MKDFVKMTGAVAVGTLLASGLAVGVMLNKKVLKGFTKKVMKISEEVADEVMSDMYDE